MFDKSFRRHLLTILASLPWEKLYKNWRETLSWEAFLAKVGKVDKVHRKKLERLLAQEDKVVFYGETPYPQLLKEISDPPPWLFYEGTLPEDRFLLAVVGSRHPSPYGRESARTLSDQLVRAGAGIVSGLARGIDGVAHWAALQAGGYTLGVLGSGLDCLYPREHKKLAQGIVQGGGALLSEFLPWMKPLPHHFPLRNRIIAGLSKGIVVVEARMKSGSLITARLAMEENREVFVVPGPINYESFRGSHQLIQQGAKLVQGVEDIVSEFPSWEKTLIHPSKEAKVPDHLLPLLHLLKVEEPLHLDQLTQSLNLPPGELNSLLTELELLGRVIRHPGGFFSKKMV